jgi:hypothetical protein
MGGHVFQCYEEQKDPRQYAKTIEALEGHVKKTMKYAGDLAPLFAIDISVPEVKRPTKPGMGSDEVDETIWREEVKDYVKQTRVLKDNMSSVMAIVWGQCSETMKTKLKSYAEYQDMYTSNDCVWILRQIKAVTLQFDSKRNGFISAMDTRASFLNCRQQTWQSCDLYLEAIKGWADNYEYHGGMIAESYKLVPEVDNKGVLRTVAERQTIARDRTLGIAYIRGADHTRFGILIAELANQYAMGTDNYPTDLNAAFSMLVNYTAPTNSSRTTRNSNPTSAAAGTSSEAPSALTFAQQGTTPGTNGVTHPDITCYNCNTVGHYASDCPGERVPTNTTLTTAGTTLVQHAFMLTQTERHGIDPNWILLDSQSTISVFRNPDMLTNIRKGTHTLRALTNGGHQDSDLVGEFPNLGTVWFNDQSIANILSLSDVRKVCRVTLDTASAPTMCVHRLDGSIMEFQEHPSGLYVFVPPNDTNNSVTAYTMISTVAEQKKLFTRREVQAADAARDLYRKIGRPSEAQFQTILRGGFIRNCPVTPDDATRALAIYGPDIAVIKGKTVKTTAAPHTPTFQAVPIPAPLIERRVTLCIDFFFVQGHAFIHTISRDIGFRTVSPVPDRSFKTILREILAVLRLYQVRGLHISDIHADNEFDCLREHVRPVAMNIAPADSHVGEIERSIRTIKERLRSCVHGLPFKRLPKLLVNHMVSDAVRCLNNFPRSNGVSSTLSPVSILTGVPSPDYNTMRLEIGSYVQVFEDNDPSNTPRARSLGAIALTPTGNHQGDYHFMSLATGARLSRHQWTELPITDTAIARVEALAIQEGQPLVQERGFVVEWRPDMPIDDDEYDRDFEPPPDPIDEFDLADYDDVAADELHDLLADVPLPPVVDQGADINNNNINHAPEGDNDEYDVAVLEDEEVEEEGANDDDEAVENHESADEDAGEEADEGAANDATGAQGADDNETTIHTTYNLRHRVPRETRNFQNAMDNPHSGKSYYPPTQLVQHTDPRKIIFGHIMTQQMSARAGIKKFGRAAEEALMSEFAQHQEVGVYEVLDPKTLTHEQKKGALRAINLVTEKRDGRIKGRTVADGRPQRLLYDKTETSSPTVATDALMITIIVDAHEQRDVGTADVVGAYLKATMTDFVIMKFTGESVDILCKLNPSNEAFVVIENGKRVLYVRLDKALYGCVKSALLWYDLFSNALVDMGFVLNPYDPCVANCNIDGKQCTVAWYVDDTKISHVDPEVVKRVIEKIEERFGKMTVVRGKEHVFLGMKIRYNDNRTVTIVMKEYLNEAIAESGLKITREAATPATRDLFEVDPDAELLPRDRAERFHSVTAKLLYVAIRARMDLLLAVAFLTTRVSKCTVEDERKLKRTLEYIKGTIDLEYILGADDLTKLRTWVDASYAVHPDMRSHTGGVMSFGTGGLAGKSWKQKLNVKSSTEAETVGASDYLPHTLWVQMFMQAQGYDLAENILEQDNESAIKLAINGRSSAGTKSRHIDIRYFWIKDRVKEGNIRVRHCPTLQMLGDFFTKPLQGALFRKFRDVILGHKHTNTLTPTLAPATEERVEDRQPGRRESEREIIGGANASTNVDTSIANIEEEWQLVGKKRREGKKVTWAGTNKKEGKRYSLVNGSNTSCVSRAFSRNNPVKLN